MELPIDDDESITVEVSDLGLTRVRAGERVGEVAARFDDAVAQVVRMGATAIKKVLATPKPPAEVEVELGLKVTAKTGFVIAESAGEAHFKVIMRWQMKGPDQP
ncbi:CU044_2847 family protein [Actinoplanes sichuanensis]|uniref:CU044_2847 family protein n=1 Tax=Actinoplanes sichuanensis TaxID=512349 RepID=A0ABW4AP45_9ACTN|nr:CU044_2847 family protein [Actinoplanes sichuanensis]